MVICGEAGAGKTSLLLELIKRGAAFIADDAVKIERREGRLWASAPETTRGMVAASPFRISEIHDVAAGAAVTVEAAVSLCVLLDRKAAPDEILNGIPQLTLSRSGSRGLPKEREEMVRRIFATLTNAEEKKN